MSDLPPQQVSGPGQFSARTDTAPGQPVRVPTGLPYGQAKQLEQAQSAVALPALAQPGSPPSPAGGGAAAPAGPPQPHPPDLLQTLSHPTQRPQESLLTPSGNTNTRVVPTQQIIQQLEQLMAQSETVPENVMRLYQGLRVEAANRGF